MNQQIKYSPEWIPKILSREKKMTIRRTAYPLGIYDVVNDATGEVVCQIEITQVEKWDTEYWLSEIEKDESYNLLITYTEGDGWGAQYNEIFPCFSRLSGFDSIKSFIEYHRNNYAPVKYAHTFNLVKKKNHVS